MKNLPKTETPEVLCFSSMGNEPGLKTESRELTPAARAMRRREIDTAKDQNYKRRYSKFVAVFYCLNRFIRYLCTENPERL